MNSLAQYLLGVLLLLLLLLSPVTLAQQGAAVPFAQLVAEGDTTIEVGESIYLRYEVWVPSWFFSSPVFPDDLASADAVSEMIKGSLISEFREIEAQRWTGLIRRYRFTPLQAGSILIQPAAISVRYASEEAQLRLERVSVVQPLSITAKIPPGAESLQPFVAARTLTLEQSLTPAGVAIRVGDAIERSISLMTDSQSPQLPSLQFEQLEGAHVYPKAEQTHRAAAKPSERPLIERVTTATYLMGNEGELLLPAIEIDWWDLHTRRLRKTQLPALRIEVLPALPQADPFRTEQTSTAAPSTPRLWFWGLLLTTAGTLLWRGKKSWLGALTSLLRWIDAELCCRWRLLHACRQNDAATADAALRCWLSAVAPGREAQLLADSALLLERGKLDKYRFALNGCCEHWHGLPLYRAACQARSNWRRSVRSTDGKRLPSLSP